MFPNAEVIPEINPCFPGEHVEKLRPRDVLHVPRREEQFLSEQPFGNICRDEPELVAAVVVKRRGRFAYPVFLVAWRGRVGYETVLVKQYLQ